MQASHPMPWPMDLKIDRQSRAAIYQQIAEALRNLILSGELGLGARLPPERKLAASLGVNRTTVVRAYDELAAEGLVSRWVGRGTTVTHQPDDYGRAGTSPILWRQLFAQGAGDLSPWIQEMLQTSLRRDVIPLMAAEPSPELFPAEEVRRLLNAALTETGSEILRYSPTEGLRPLREAIARRMANRGAHLAWDNVLVTAGAQQGIDLLARTFLEAGDEVAIESPTYPGAIQSFRQRGARLIAIPVDGEGMRVDVLEQALSRRSVKLVFVMPNFNNPSGALLSRERRQRLLEVTRRYRLPVVEDDVYGEIHFEDSPPSCLVCLDPSDHVIHVSSVSKMLFPGLRVGWVAAPAAVIERLALLKQTTDLHTGTLSQWLVLQAVQTGLLDQHLLRIRPLYRERRDVLLEALVRHCGHWLTPNRPQGGINLWCRLPEGFRSRDLLVEATHMNVTFVPGETFSVHGGEQSYLRVGFGLLSLEALQEGARRLGQAIELYSQRQRPEPVAGGARPLV